jgi:predicted dehydrogenase
MTVDPGDAWELVEIARRVDRQLLLSFGWNYMPVVREAKALMDTHGIGSIEQMSVTMGSSTRELLTNTGAYPDASPDSAPNPDTWTNPARSGGGYGQAQLSHALGLALHLSGMRATDAFAYMSAPLDAPVELHDAIVMRFEGGAIGTLSGASTHVGAGKDKHQLDVRIVGSDGQFYVDLFRELVWLYRSDGRDFDLEVAPGEALYDASTPANALVDIALGRQLNDCAPGELGARTVEALSLAYRSSVSGKSEHL